ncbi:MAG: polysaccharide biosynthesis C-terminal domain-containing protein, partial [Flavobacteriales bacterium]
AALLNLFLNLILMYFFKDILIAAIATLLSYLVLSLAAYRGVKDIVDLRFNFIEWFKVLIAASVAGFLVHLTMMGLSVDFGLGLISLLILEYVCVYAICLGFLKSEVLIYLYQRI